MRYPAFTMYDSVARVYTPPFFMASAAVAIRAFALAANTPDSKVGLSTSDFTLFEIGVFDDETGAMEPIGAMINHGLAASFKKEIPHASE
ncbi:MAG: nonstructural protein [Microvirus sp.]|nr:MAG: nonstructural protein [Microvirus sp.]